DGRKILHKAEAGGVALNLRSDVEVRAAASSMSKRAAAAAGADAVDGFLIQRMVKGLEMMIGFREDPQFGPFALIGFGGVLVELLDDVALRLLPLSEACVRDMLRSLKGAKLLDGPRGTAPRDADALVRTALALERAFLTCRNTVRDLEANPVIVGEAGEGVWAVDVRAT
ncbi:MAG: acetate--CoA ligase family protein, partial [Acidobacteria bacterium]|nr:acetate--CoA ligase family protein [Acidobacteriota bacterium]